MTKKSIKQIAATTLAVVFGIVAGIDIVGTPLAIIAINHAASASDRAKSASDSADQFAKNLGEAVIRSRKEDCVAQEKLRALGRKRLKQKEKETPAILKLLHIRDTPQVKALSERQFHEERELLKPVDCVAYANKAHP